MGTRTETATTRYNPPSSRRKRTSTGAPSKSDRPAVPPWRRGRGRGGGWRRCGPARGGPRGSPRGLRRTTPDPAAGGGRRRPGRCHGRTPPRPWRRRRSRAPARLHRLWCRSRRPCWSCLGRPRRRLRLPPFGDPSPAGARLAPPLRPPTAPPRARPRPSVGPARLAPRPRRACRAPGASPRPRVGRLGGPAPGSSASSRLRTAATAGGGFAPRPGRGRRAPRRSGRRGRAVASGRADRRARRRGRLGSPPSERPTTPGCAPPRARPWGRRSSPRPPRRCAVPTPTGPSSAPGGRSRSAGRCRRTAARERRVRSPGPRTAAGRSCRGAGGAGGEPTGSSPR